MPRTEAGKRQHDLAWGDWVADENEYVNGHSAQREGCGACAAIAAIEAEAVTAERARIAAAMEGLRVATKKAGRLAESDYFQGFRASRNETVAAVLAIVNREDAG